MRPLNKINLKAVFVLALSFLLVSCNNESFVKVKEPTSNASTPVAVGLDPVSGNQATSETTGSTTPQCGDGEVIVKDVCEIANPKPITPTGPTYQTVTESFTQTSDARPAEIVWVIDNSGSMGDNQQQLVDNFDLFLNNFLQKNIEFKMAITSTDPSSTGKSVILQSGADWSLYSNVAYQGTAADGLFINPVDLLTSTVYQQDTGYFRYLFTGKAEDLALANCGSNCLSVTNPILGIDYGYSRLGVYGSGYEKGLQSIYRSLERAIEQKNDPAATITRNKDFFTTNPDAFTIFIVISDEEDYYNVEFPNDNLGTMSDSTGSYLGNVKDMMQTLGRDPSKLRVHSIINRNGTGFKDLGYNGYYGNRYATISNETQGNIYALNELTDPTNQSSAIKSFGDQLANMADDLNILLTGFALGQAPAQGYEIIVKVDGQTKVKDQDWYYDTTNNTVLFAEGHIPAVNSTITIEYTVETSSTTTIAAN